MRTGSTSATTRTSSRSRTRSATATDHVLDRTTGAHPSPADPGRGPRGRRPVEPALRDRPPAPAGAIGPGIRVGRAGSCALDRRPRRVHLRLPHRPRFPRCRGHRLSVDVLQRRPDGGREAAPELAADADLAINISPYIKRMGPMVMSHHARYPNLAYIAQDLGDPRAPALGRVGPGRPKDRALPVHTSHPLFVENKIRFFVDPWPWIDALRGAQFAFGSRIHGNIAGAPCRHARVRARPRFADPRARALLRDPAPAR